MGDAPTGGTAVTASISAAISDTLRLHVATGSRVLEFDARHEVPGTAGMSPAEEQDEVLRTV